MTRLTLNVFVDACGWDVLESRPWFLPELGHRQPVESIFGYSSACVPSILSGLRPDEHDHFCFLRWDPAGSPFHGRVGWLRRLPAPIREHGRVRRVLSSHLARRLGIDGYFSLYDLPLERLEEVDWTEKRDLFEPGGLNRGASIFDALTEAGIPYHVSDWRTHETTRFSAATRAIGRGGVRFAFVYAADLDALRHRHPDDGARIDAYLRTLQDSVRALISAARARYDEVEVALFSDHGMTRVHRTRDLMREVDALGLTWGRDYAAIYDSTMARFWFLSDRAEERIANALPDDARGGWVDAATKRRWGVDWADARFGDAFYLLAPGALLVPSHLGRARLAGMHGYRVDDAHSHATLLATDAPRRAVKALPDLNVMMRDAVGLDAARRAA